MLLIGKAVSEVPGVKAGIAMSRTLNCIEMTTGIPTEEFRLALPAATNTPAALNATKLGEKVGKSAQAVNKLLHTRGFQRRNERNEWELTPEGEKWAEAFPFTKNGHSGYQTLWNSLDPRNSTSDHPYLPGVTPEIPPTNQGSLCKTPRRTTHCEARCC